MSVRSIVRNAMRPLYFPVMAHKVYLRFRYGHSRETEAATAWAAERAEDVGAWCRRIDAGVWREAEEFARRLAESARPRVQAVQEAGVDLGGPGCIELLYFLTRIQRPEIVVETGVAAGWSSAAVLGAMRENKSGHLFSSDFPCFRLSDPERYIGYVVPAEAKDSWTLLLKGDRKNLNEILGPSAAVGLAHYDSDKTRGGREFFLRRIAPHLTSRSILVMDDIQDNLVFREYVAGQAAFHVFRYGGKYIGMTGAGIRALERGGVSG
jgi:predicted O-methyltransferase YrrM